MRFLHRRLTALDHQHKANGSAVAIALMAVLFLQLESPPRPAGADTTRYVATKSAPVVAIRKTETPPSDENLTPEQLAERALLKKVELLEKGIAFLMQTPDYTAQFSKLEVVGGELLEEQTMLIKLTHKPFSVYMKWMDYDTGREVIYGEGLNDGNLLVHAGGWKARLPAISMEPDSSLAMRESRHPITNVGLLNLAKKIVDAHRLDLAHKSFARCEQTEDQSVNGRDCLCFVTEYNNGKTSKEYRKSIVLIDKE
ncbi:MAG: DUF1571 domain-containing protein, partial [Candidatus Saccharimonas sp.]|nr:DUF1571 domain-containing protein [Planctomycetaceae bacterium]